jgi:hypothetical protein
MFGDSSWHEDTASEEAWEAWRQGVLSLAAERRASGCTPLRVAIIEAGAGGNVTTIRNESEHMLSSLNEAGAVARLVRINPELPLADQPHHQSFTLSIASRGLEAFKAIAQHLDTMRTRPRDEIFALDEAGVPPLQTLPRREWC